MPYLKLVIVLLTLSVAVILGLGLRNMMKNGDIGRSQKLMRLRVGVQFIVVALVMTALYLFTR